MGTSSVLRGALTAKENFTCLTNWAHSPACRHFAQGAIFQLTACPLSMKQVRKSEPSHIFDVFHYFPPALDGVIGGPEDFGDAALFLNGRQGKLILGKRPQLVRGDNDPADVPRAY